MDFKKYASDAKNGSASLTLGLYVVGFSYNVLGILFLPFKKFDLIKAGDGECSHPIHSTRSNMLWAVYPAIFELSGVAFVAAASLVSVNVGLLNQLLLNAPAILCLFVTCLNLQISVIKNSFRKLAIPTFKGGPNDSLLYFCVFSPCMARG